MCWNLLETQAGPEVPFLLHTPVPHLVEEWGFVLWRRGKRGCVGARTGNGGIKSKYTGFLPFSTSTMLMSPCSPDRQETGRVFSGDPDGPKKTDLKIVISGGEGVPNKFHSQITCSLPAWKGTRSFPPGFQLLPFKQGQSFPGGAVVENLPANAGDTGSSPGLGRSHMPRSN